MYVAHYCDLLHDDSIINEVVRSQAVGNEFLHASTLCLFATQSQMGFDLILLDATSVRRFTRLGNPNHNRINKNFETQSPMSLLKKKNHQCLL